MVSCLLQQQQRAVGETTLERVFELWYFVSRIDFSVQFAVSSFWIVKQNFLQVYSKRIYVANPLALW